MLHTQLLDHRLPFPNDLDPIFIASSGNISGQNQFGSILKGTRWYQEDWRCLRGVAGHQKLEVQIRNVFATKAQWKRHCHKVVKTKTLNSVHLFHGFFSEKGLWPLLLHCVLPFVASRIQQRAITPSTFLFDSNNLLAKQPYQCQFYSIQHIWFTKRIFQNPICYPKWKKLFIPQ